MELVKRVFQLYSTPLTSLGEIANALNEEGILPPSGSGLNSWQGLTIQRIVSNPCYVKADISIYSFYKSRGVTIDASKNNNIENFNGEQAALLLGKLTLLKIREPYITEFRHPKFICHLPNGLE